MFLDGSQIFGGLQPSEEPPFKKRIPTKIHGPPQCDEGKSAVQLCTISLFWCCGVFTLNYTVLCDFIPKQATILMALVTKCWGVQDSIPSFVRTASKLLWWHLFPGCEGDSERPGARGCPATGAEGVHRSHGRCGEDNSCCTAFCLRLLHLCRALSSDRCSQRKDPWCQERRGGEVEVQVDRFTCSLGRNEVLALWPRRFGMLWSLDWTLWSNLHYDQVNFSLIWFVCISFHHLLHLLTLITTWTLHLFWECIDWDTTILRDTSDLKMTFVLFWNNICGFWNGWCFRKTSEGWIILNHLCVK